MHSIRRTGRSKESVKNNRSLREKPVAAVRARRLFSRKRKFTAGLLAAICPGLGHFYLGLYRKGIAFMFTLLLDASALLYFSSIGMQINVPLLILLALVIPVTYFYNVYDVLQAADFMILRRVGTSQDDEEMTAYKHPFSVERGPFFGIMLIVGGALMFAFYQKPRWLQFYIEQYGGITVAILLIATGLWAGGREVWILWKQRRFEKFREGDR